MGLFEKSLFSTLQRWNLFLVANGQDRDGVLSLALGLIGSLSPGLASAEAGGDKRGVGRPEKGCGTSAGGFFSFHRSPTLPSSRGAPARKGSHGVAGRSECVASSILLAGCGCSPTAHSCVLCCMFPDSHFSVCLTPVPSYLLSVVSICVNSFTVSCQKGGRAWTRTVLIHSAQRGQAPL